MSTERTITLRWWETVCYASEITVPADVPDAGAWFDEMDDSEWIDLVDTEHDFEWVTDRGVIDVEVTTKEMT